MDKKLLALFRKMLNLDETTLPDSISPEDFGKLVEKQMGNRVKPEDFKELQQKLSLKDVEIKKISDEMEKLKNSKNKQNPDSDEFKKVLETISKLNDEIATMNREKKLESLKKRYPDISPNLLIDLPDDKLDKIVEEQREVSKSIYKGADVFVNPSFKSVDEIQKRIDDIKSDKNMTGIEKTSQVIKLERMKGQFATQ